MGIAASVDCLTFLRVLKFMVRSVSVNAGLFEQWFSHAGLHRWSRVSWRVPMHLTPVKDAVEDIPFKVA